MRKLIVAAIVMACAGLAAVARADDKGDPSGAWKWTVTQGGKHREVVVVLKLEGNRVTGSMKRPSGPDLKVEEGTYRDGEVSFNVPGTAPDVGPMMHRYKGKLEGDTIKGTAEIERNGQTFRGKWEANRSRD